MASTTSKFRWLFTFGFGQTDPKTGRSLADCYVWVEGADIEDCRFRMLDRFGRSGGAGNWAFDYPDAEAADVERFGLTEIDLETGAVLA